MNAPSTLDIGAAFARAQRCWQAKQGHEAEALLHSILREVPDHAETLHFLALITSRGDVIELMRRACAAPGARPIFFSNLTEFCRRAGKLTEAEAAGRAAVARDPKLAQAWNNLGIVLQERGVLEESRACLERSLQLAPALAEAQMNLGNTLRQMGKLDLAGAAYQRALTARPNYAEAFSNFAVALCDLGQFDEAARHSARAIELAPQLPDAYANAAIIEMRRRRHPQAEELIVKALKMGRDQVPVLLLGAAIYKSLRRYGDAERLARHAIVLAPEHGEARHALALVLHLQSRYDESLATFDEAIALLPQAGQAFVNRGLVLGELGRQKEALAAFDLALERQPGLASAWFNRANAKKFSKDDPDLARMEAVFASGEAQSHDDRTLLRFALSKAWLDAGNPDRAFIYLTEGNQLKRSATTYDSPAARGWMREIAAQFPAGVFRSDEGDPSDLPVFVMGMPRSGTTLVEQTLAAHGEIFGAGELHEIADLAGMFTRKGAPYPQAMAQFTSQDMAQLGKEYVARLRARAPTARRIVDKMPANFFYAGFIRRILPNARIIHCRRDPLDTCFSCYAKLFAGEQEFSYDLTELGQFYRGYEKLMAHWRDVLPPENFIEVEYADMVGDFEASARRLIDFCGLEWDAECLRFHESARPVRTASLYQVRQPVYASSLGRAHAYLEHLAPLAAALAGD